MGVATCTCVDGWLPYVAVYNNVYTMQGEGEQRRRVFSHREFLTRLPDDPLNPPEIGEHQEAVLMVDPCPNCKVGWVHPDSRAEVKRQTQDQERESFVKKHKEVQLSEDEQDWGRPYKG